MNKFLVVLGVIVSATVVWMVFQPSTINYVATVNSEIDALQAELASIEDAVQAGTLTTSQAAEAQVRIANRIESITTHVTTGKNTTLTDAQRADLVIGLRRLVTALEQYKATLEAVDTAVLTLPEVERPKLNRTGGGSGSSRSGVAVIALDTADTLEVQVEEIIEAITDEQIVEEVTNENLADEDTVTGEEGEASTTTDESVSDSVDESADTTDDTTPPEVLEEQSTEIETEDDSTVTQPSSLLPE